jgi:hypothetical protein
MKFSKVTVRLFKSYLRNDDSAERAGFVEACRTINNSDTNTFLVLSCVIDNLSFVQASLKYCIKNKDNKPDVEKYKLIDKYKADLEKYRKEFSATLTHLEKEGETKLVRKRWIAP